MLVQHCKKYLQKFLKNNKMLFIFKEMTSAEEKNTNSLYSL